MFEVQAVDFYDITIHTKVDVVKPDHCPSCHVKVDAKLLGSYLSGNGLESRYLERVFRCPGRGCGSVFVAVYRGYFSMGGYESKASFYDYKLSGPGSPVPPELPESVCKMSPDFENLYKQAMAAEHYGLDQICGVGLRKALEFLVKDYLISVSDKIGVDAQTIKKKALAQCINDHIEDTKTKNIAKRAAWLGNDETHYLRKWEDKDLKDLKVLLHLTMNAIENALLADEYIEQMNPDETKASDA